MTIIDAQSLDIIKHYWFNDAKNLVTSLAKIYGPITLEKISQKVAKANEFEKALLNAKKSLVRQITLSSNTQLLVFARTIVPYETYLHFSQELDNLNTKPIGDNLLFDKSKFNRSGFIIRRLSAQEFTDETGLSSEYDIYSRSSTFEYKNSKDLKFLITEYFIIIPEQHNA